MNDSKSPRRLLLVGATGAVGCEVMKQALAYPRVSEVVALTRRPLARAEKLVNIITDFDALPEHASWWAADAVICTLGTTIKTAGSQAAFAAVDRDLPIAIATAARRAGTPVFALNSSLGASLKGNFYLRTKAEAEAGIRALGFPSYTVVRPSLIDATRSEPRRGEQLGLAVSRVLRPLIPRRYRPVSAAAIARALLRSALDAVPGDHVIESEAIID
ncbi:MAG: NAD(P)H-binding protein [Sulfuritalea sp.]|nr:NAD(P)H-binding protein [Sulfuritalea sp.]